MGSAQLDGVLFVKPGYVVQQINVHEMSVAIAVLISSGPGSWVVGEILWEIVVLQLST